MLPQLAARLETPIVLFYSMECKGAIGAGGCWGFYGRRGGEREGCGPLSHISLTQGTEGEGLRRQGKVVNCNGRECGWGAMRGRGVEWEEACGPLNHTRHRGSGIGEPCDSSPVFDMVTCSESCHSNLAPSLVTPQTFMVHSQGSHVLSSTLEVHGRDTPDGQ